MGFRVGRRNRIRWRFRAVVEKDSIVWTKGMVYDEVVEIIVLGTIRHRHEYDRKYSHEE